MDTPLPELTIPHSFGDTLQNMVLHADPVVKGVMLLLALASVICWAIILEKAIRLAVFDGQVRRLERFCQTLAEIPDRGAWLAVKLFGAAQRQEFSAEESRYEREARLEKAMRLAARRELSRLAPRMRFLATVGATAPFIGLFGTVWGIMNSFTAIAAQKDTSLAVVAPGIAEALFATALGLVAAIPAVIAYNQISGALSRSGERINFAISLVAENVLRRAGDAR